MRSLLPLVVLCAFSSAPLRAADIFDITLTGNPGSPSGSGIFTTDGICSVCTPGAGLLSLTINLGPFSGPEAFDICDDILGVNEVVYQRPTNMLEYVATNSEHLATGVVLNMVSNGMGGT